MAVANPKSLIISTTLMTLNLKEIMCMDFLNSILPQEHQIRTLTFQKTEQLPEHEEERKSVFDILCKDIHGETFIVEMQRANMAHFIDRTIYYGTFPIQSQAKKGRWDFNLARVYLIAVLDFEYDKHESI